MSSIVLTCVGSLPSPFTHAPLNHLSVCGSASSAIPASSCALSLIFAVALAIAAGAPPDGLVLKPWPLPKRSVSAGTTLTSSAGTPSSCATSWAYSGSCPSASVVRLSTILPVGCTRRKTARYAASLIAGSPLLGQSLPLLVGGQRVVVLAVAERRLWAAQRVRGHGRAIAAGIDAELGLVRQSKRLAGRAGAGAGVERPPGSGPAAARPVPARHRDRAARDRRRARPRVLHGSRLGGGRRRHGLARDRVDHLAERAEAVAADERVAVRQR